MNVSKYCLVIVAAAGIGAAFASGAKAKDRALSGRSYQLAETSRPLTPQQALILETYKKCVDYAVKDTIQQFDLWKTTSADFEKGVYASIRERHKRRINAPGRLVSPFRLGHILRAYQERFNPCVSSRNRLLCRSGIKSSC